MDRSRTNLGTAAGILLSVYSLGLGLAVLVSAPWWVRGLRAGGRYREGLRERLGSIPRERLLAPGCKGELRGAVWIHAVSVGEVLAVAPLVAALRQALPQRRVFVSTTTRTGQRTARARFGGASVFYFPADFRFAVRAWLRFLQPSVIVLAESELWPRFLYEAVQAAIPVMVVNARISARSWPRYRRLRLLWRPLLRTLALVHAQSAQDAQRLAALGAPRVEVGGNLKYDVALTSAGSLLASLRQQLPAGVPVLVCGSTLAGEEALLLRSLSADTVLLLAPRHPERFDEVAALLAAGERPFLRISAWRTVPQPIDPRTVLLLDSVGELAALYALATIAIVGGGFLHGGGHNPLEPAALGATVIVGPGYANFVDIVHTLQAADALRIAGPVQLHETVAHLLAHPEEAQAIGSRARLVCERQAGATARALAAIQALVPA